MRRVLLTSHKFFPQHRAGTEVLTLKIAQDLQRRGYEVLVVTANPPDADARHFSPTETSDYVYDAVPVHVIEESLRLKNYTFKHEYQHGDIGAHFAKVIEAFAPDLVHMLHCQNLSASILDIPLAKQIPIVFSATDFWFICPVVQLKRPNGALCRGPAPYAANCLTCYTPQLFPPVDQIQEALEDKHPALANTINSLPSPLAKAALDGISKVYVASKLPEAIAATVERPKILRDRLNSVDCIMVATKLMRDIFVENGIKPELIRHVKFGIDTSPLIPFQQKQPSTVLRLGFIGTISEHKGVDLLIKAVQSLPINTPVHLAVYGDMQQFPHYATTIKELVDQDKSSLNRISFAGTFPNEELGSILQNLDVLVVPSRWYENTPLVIQSALSTKTPVLATNLGGMSELITNNVNGLLFELNDWQSLRQQILRLVDEPDLLPTLIKNIAPERTIIEMVDQIEQIYEAIIRRTDRVEIS